MKLLTAVDAGRLAEALSVAFPSVNHLEELLQSGGLERRFDDYTSKFLPLRDNARDIVNKARAEGWVLELLNVALKERQDNPLLKALWASLPEADAAAAEPPVDDDRRPSLECGRDKQWGLVCKFVPANRHHVLLVTGAAGQATMHFRDRIRTYLLNEPRRSIVIVDWPTRPVKREAFFEAIAKALQVDVSLLAETISSRLTVENLVLLHDCVKIRFGDENLVKYYTEWVPELLKNSPDAHKFKCVQPIEWPVEPRSFLRLFSSKASENQEQEARSLVSGLQASPAAIIQVVGLDELLDLTDGEIRSWVQTSTLTSSQQAAMLTHLLAERRRPEQLFETIDAYWNVVRAAS